MMTILPSPIHDVITEFNVSGDPSLLVALFATRALPVEHVLNLVNDKGSESKLLKLQFSLLRLDQNYIIYINEMGKAVFTRTDPTSLKAILNEIKHAASTSRHPRVAGSLEAATLLAGQGSIKSYDAFSTVDTTVMTGAEIKKTLHNPEIWTTDRQLIHKAILEHALVNVRNLSQFIESSRCLERGLYCFHGTVASGKSSLLRELLQRDERFDPSLLSGVINTDWIKRELIRRTSYNLGSSYVSYLFHDEASMLNKKLLEMVKSEDLLYIIDKRMQEVGELEELIADAKERKLPLILFDVRTDFATSAFRVLGRSGVYPSDPAPDFDGLFKSFNSIEQSRSEFLRTAIGSPHVKELREVHTSDSIKAKTRTVALKHDYTITSQGELALLGDENILLARDELAHSIMPYGGTLKTALDSHSREAFSSPFSKSTYHDRFLKNIENTSRTFHGELNTSASADKRDKVNGNLPQSTVSFYGQRNLNSAFEYIYSNKNLALISPTILKYFVSQLAVIINNDLVLDTSNLLRHGQNSSKYNYVDTRYVPDFFESFIHELYDKLIDIDCDPVATAAWIEWNVDFSGHLFADGCGRIAKALSSWSLMRRNHELPDYELGRDDQESIRASYRKRFAIQGEVPYKKPTRDERYAEFLAYYKRLFTSVQKARRIEAAGGLIYNDAGQFLILQTAKARDHSKWVIPGGKVGIHEAPTTTFEREVFEETGLRLRSISQLGKREYVSRRGNPYLFFDFTTRAVDATTVSLNEEATSYAWIMPEQIGDYTFTESIKDFLRTYFNGERLDYYKHTEVINPSELDVPDFYDHTMTTNLSKYIASKLPVDDLDKYLPFVERFEVHGIYPSLDVLSRLDLDFEIIKVISEKGVKEYSSNSVRPIFLLVKRASEKFIICCTIPGSDLLLHYASMIAHFLKKYPHVSLSVSSYPLAERQIDSWTDLDSTIVQPKDIIVLGYGTFMKQRFAEDPEFTIISTASNKCYSSSRFQSKNDTNIVVNCLEAKYSYWGNLSNYIANKICRLGAKEIIHIGKVGTLSNVSDVYNRIFVPSSFAIGRRQEPIQNVRDMSNSLAYIKHYLSGVHISVATTMEETLMQRNYFEKHGIETIDIESARIAEGIATYNRNRQHKVRYGSIHFASDYLRKDDSLNTAPEIDLSTERSAKIHEAKNDLLKEIYILVKQHVTGMSERVSTEEFASAKA